MFRLLYCVYNFLINLLMLWKLHELRHRPLSPFTFSVSVNSLAFPSLLETDLEYRERHLLQLSPEHSTPSPRPSNYVVNWNFEARQAFNTFSANGRETATRIFHVSTPNANMHFRLHKLILATRFQRTCVCSGCAQCGSVGRCAFSQIASATTAAAHPPVRPTAPAPTKPPLTISELLHGPLHVCSASAI